MLTWLHLIRTAFDPTSLAALAAEAKITVEWLRQLAHGLWERQDARSALQRIYRP